jgi:hypothetical protein
MASNIIASSASVFTSLLTDECIKIKVILWPMVSYSVSLGVEPHLRTHDQIFITLWQLRSCFCEVPSLTWGRVFFCICCWLSPAYSFSDPCPLVLVTIFYSLRFETSLFVASYNSQGHGGGIRTRLHMRDVSQVKIVLQRLQRRQQAWLDIYINDAHII